jgi:chromosome segregation ATPase
MKLKTLAATTAILALIAIPVSTAQAQTLRAPAEAGTSSGQSSTNPIIDDFRDGIAGFHQDLDVLSKRVDDMDRLLGETTAQDIEAHKLKLDAFRGAITGFGSKFEPGSALAAKIDKLDAFIAAQQRRLGALQDKYGVEWTQQRIDEYRSLQAEVASARQQISEAVNAARNLLNTVMQAKDRLAELALLKNTQIAVKALRELGADIHATLEGMTRKINAMVQPPGA